MGIKYIGDSNQLSFRFESGTYANTSGTRQWIGLVQDHTPDEGAGVTPIRYQGNYSRNIGLFTDGQLEYGGTFTFYPQDWKFLGMAMGSVYSPAGSHLIRESDSDDKNYAVPTQSLSSFNLEDTKKTHTAGSNFIRTFNGCMIDSFTSTWAQGEPVSCEVSYMAQNSTFTSGAVTTVTPTTTRPFMYSNALLQIPSGTVVDNATEFSFTVNNNLEVGHYNNGSRVAKEQLPLNRDYEVSASFIMDTGNAKQLYDQYFIGGSSFNSMVEMKAVAGSAAIIMSGCRITDMEVPSPVEGINEQTCTIMPTAVSANVYDDIGSYTFA